MANREACEVYIEQEIEAGLEDGKTPYAIGKELSDWVAKLFEVRIHPKTIATRVYRHPDFSSNEEKKSNNESECEEIEENSRKEIGPEIKTDRGGKREGAGRKPKPNGDQKRIAQNAKPKPNLTKSQLLIELNKKIGEFYIKEQEYVELEKQNKEYVKNNPGLQASMMYGVVLGAIRIIEKRIDRSVEEKTATFIPKDQLAELSNRWQKISLFINNKIKEARNEISDR